MLILLKEVTLAAGLLMQSGADVQHDDLICLARTVYAEARGEPREGQLAVAYVVLERTGVPGYPETICDVVLEPNQFATSEMDLPKNWEAYQAAMLVALDVLQGKSANPVEGATYFYAYKKAKPYWARQFTEIAVIGNHRFMEQ